MNHKEQIESLEKYLREMAAAVSANRRNILAFWNRHQKKVYLDEHYPVNGTLLEQSIRLRLEFLINAGPIAYLIHGYGYGLDRSFDLITNQEMTAHLVKAHQELCVNQHVHIGIELFRDIAIHAAMSTRSERNWSEV